MRLKFETRKNIKEDLKRFYYTDPYDGYHMILEENNVIGVECEECGHVTDQDHDEDNECENCGGEGIFLTAYDGCYCYLCGSGFGGDLEENAVRLEEAGEVVCEECVTEIWGEIEEEDEYDDDDEDLSWYTLEDDEEDGDDE